MLDKRRGRWPLSAMNRLCPLLARKYVSRSFNQKLCKQPYNVRMPAYTKEQKWLLKNLRTYMPLEEFMTSLWQAAIAQRPDLNEDAFDDLDNWVNDIPERLEPKDAIQKALPLLERGRHLLSGDTPKIDSALFKLDEAYDILFYAAKRSRGGPATLRASAVRAFMLKRAFPGIEWPEITDRLCKCKAKHISKDPCVHKMRVSHRNLIRAINSIENKYGIRLAPDVKK